MKAIKSFLICAVAVTPLVIQPTAQAQSKPEFCQIHNGNVNRYTSKYNLFDNSSNTPIRPFVQNNRIYNINQDLSAKPLFYTAISNGNVVSAFELKGKLGKLFIGSRDVVTQYIVQNQIGTYAEILGHCINGVFIQSPQQEAYDIYKLPLETQSALQEAKFGISQERIGNMFK